MGEKIRALMQKRIFNIPVLYIIAVIVAVLAYFAWKMKPQADFSSAPGDTQGAPEDGTTLPAETDPYDSLATGGTVTVVQQPADTSVPTVEKTNEQWVRDGAEWAVTPAAQALGVVTTGSEAAAALNRYVYGQDVSFDEKKIVDAVIKEKGQPPEPISGTGSISNESPAQRQGNPPTSHTVKGNNDNTYGKIAQLYYGRSGQTDVDLIQAANVNKLGFDGPFARGTVVVVPKYSAPVYFTTTKTVRSRDQIAAKNGVTGAQIEALNNTGKTDYGVGARVRVR